MWIKDVVARGMTRLDGFLGQFCAPEPQICGTGIEIKIEVLERGADTNLCEVLGVLLDILGLYFANLARGVPANHVRDCVAMTEMCPRLESVQKLASARFFDKIMDDGEGRRQGWSDLVCRGSVELLHGPQRQVLAYTSSRDVPEIYVR